MRLRIEAEVGPTESIEKVEKAVKNIFPDLELSLSEGKLIGESTDVRVLKKLHDILRIQRVLDAARAVMFNGTNGDRVVVHLNKQVAFVGKVSFVDGETPLGPITVALEAPDIERLIDYLAPRTIDGRPVEEISYW